MTRFVGIVFAGIFAAALGSCIDTWPVFLRN